MFPTVLEPLYASSPRCQSHSARCRSWFPRVPRPLSACPTVRQTRRRSCQTFLQLSLPLAGLALRQNIRNCRLGVPTVRAFENSRLLCVIHSGSRAGRKISFGSPRTIPRPPQACGLVLWYAASPFPAPLPVPKAFSRSASWRSTASGCRV